jgi:cysteine desulfurase
MLYLDHAAATQLRPEAREAMEPFLGGIFGNPSGIHAESRRARAGIDDARERIAALLGAEHPLDVVFTSGGTESVNLGVKGPVLAGGPAASLVTTAIEHEAVLASAAALERVDRKATVVAVDGLGRVDPGDVALAVDGSTRVVSVMTANNETGVVQPVAKVAAAVRAAGERVLVHTDAVQAALSQAVTLDALDVDAVSVSSHKVGGPKGAGVLVLRPGIDLEPVLHGGGQELGRRSGTPDVAAIVGMAAALEVAAAQRDGLRRLLDSERDTFEERVTRTVPGAAVTGSGVDRLSQHAHLRFPGIDAETLLIRLDGAGLAASAGSACHSGAVRPSHVLRAMGMTEAEARECVRFTFGWTTRVGDGAAAADIVASCAEALL